MDWTTALADAPVFQQPVVPSTDAPVRLSPFKMPAVEAGEVAKPRVLAINPRVRGKRNPIMSFGVGGQDFVQYRLPSRATEVGVNPATVAPVLPIVMLTDKQVAALRERAELLVVRDSFRPPVTDTDALTGAHEIKASEFIVIADYVEGANVFALARTALKAQEALVPQEARAPQTAGADEIEKANNALRLSNSEPQRGEAVAAAARGSKHKG